MTGTKVSGGWYIHDFLVVDAFKTLNYITGFFLQYRINLHSTMSWQITQENDLWSNDCIHIGKYTWSFFLTAPIIFPLFCVKQRPDTLTTGGGHPIGDKLNLQTAGPKGPLLVQDVVFTDEMAHFDRERIPERVVHAKGAGECWGWGASVFRRYLIVSNKNKGSTNSWGYNMVWVQFHVAPTPACL